MRRILGFVALAGLAGLLALAPLSAADERDRRDRDDGDKGERRARISDQEFVLKASAANLAEQDLGTLGEKNARSDEVRRFAERMVKDHRQANERLNRLANTKRIPVAASADARQQATAAKLAVLKGAAFDREFAKVMVKEHEAAVALFESAAEGAQDKDVRGLAKKTLPTLRDHLKMARDLAGGRGGRDHEDGDRDGGRKGKARKDRDLDDKDLKDKGRKDRDVEDTDKGRKDKDLEDKGGRDKGGDKDAAPKGGGGKDRPEKDR